LFAFDIVAFSKDSSTVIDVSKFYGSDVKAISGLSASMRETYKVKGMDDSRSFITAMKSFPMKKSFRILLIMRLSRLFLKIRKLLVSK
jgi:hypothetical protein